MEEINLDETLVCNFCNKKFSNKHNLKVHQNTAKYCNKLRNKSSEDESTTSINKCLYCEKSFTSKQTLTYHLRICRKVLTHELKDYYTKQMNEMEEKYKATIKTLENQIKNMESKYKEKTIFHLA